MLPSRVRAPFPTGESLSHGPHLGRGFPCRVCRGPFLSQLNVSKLLAREGPKSGPFLRSDAVPASLQSGWDNAKVHPIPIITYFETRALSAITPTRSRAL